MARLLAAPVVSQRYEVGSNVNQTMNLLQEIIAALEVGMTFTPPNILGRIGVH